MHWKYSFIELSQQINSLIVNSIFLEFEQENAEGFLNRRARRTQRAFLNRRTRRALRMRSSLLPYD